MSDILLNPKLENLNTPTTIKLQNIIFPNLDICSVEELFFRLNSKAVMNYQQTLVELKQGGRIIFDTYFNAFSVQKWKDYTNVKSININLCLKGAFQINLINIDYLSEAPKLIDQKIITSQILTDITAFNDIDISPYKGLLYIEIEALKNNCLLTGGYFNINRINRPKADIKIAVVMCTYKREEYVEKNVKLLEKYFLKNSTSIDKFELFLIDNGRTLEEFDNPKIHLIPNKNAGGSGGYTRGVLEVLKRKNDFSHIIFMDDDVIIYPEVFERIYNFQMVTNDKSLCTGGSMLKLDCQYIQHENGSIWADQVVRLKPDLDLRNIKNILFNEIEEHISYNGWWLFCFPINVIDDFSLPYPFFIRGDDIELPIRLDLKIITLNGICVWHESFENKCSPTPNYYSRKNEMILNSIYSDSFSKIDAIKYLLKFSMKEAFCYRYKSADLVLRAVYDFLQGPNYLKSVNPEEKNLDIKNIGEQPVKNHDLPFIYEKYEKSLGEAENMIHRLLRLMTLNGHLLPSLFFHQDSKLTDQGYKVIPMHGYRPLNVFRAKKALYYHINNQEGFVVNFSRVEFWKIFIKTIILSVKIFLNFSQVKQLYRKTLPELTNKTFWEQYLEINKYSKSE
ncbi:MAG: glycosyltransferase [Gloeotrichia echinulata IR180]